MHIVAMVHGFRAGEILTKKDFIKILLHLSAKALLEIP